MVGEQAEMNLSTNRELYCWICCGETPPADRGFLPGQIESCRAYWNDLKNFSKEKNLLEANFNGKTEQTFHSSFWELYLPKAFDVAGIRLFRGKEGQPDFYFEKGGQEIWLEAVACGEPQEQNAVPPPGEDFESNTDGFYANQTMRAMATAIDSKIKKWNDGYKRNVHEEPASFVIALNGWRALNRHFDAAFPDDPPMITKTLFGMGDLWLSRHGQNISQCYKHAEKTKPLQDGGNGAPIAHFKNPANKEIAGVLYSAANIFETRCDIFGHDFIFVQNPHAADVSTVFNSMQVKESLDLAAGLKPVPIWRLDLRTGKVLRSEPQEPCHGG